MTWFYDKIDHSKIVFMYISRLWMKWKLIHVIVIAYWLVAERFKKFHGSNSKLSLDIGLVYFYLLFVELYILKNLRKNKLYEDSKRWKKVQPFMEKKLWNQIICMVFSSSGHKFLVTRQLFLCSQIIYNISIAFMKVFIIKNLMDILPLLLLITKLLESLYCECLESKNLKNCNFS